MNNVLSASHKALLTRDAIGLLTRDHRKVQQLFRKFELMKDNGDAAQTFEIAKIVCGNLLIHMAIEEAIFYPAVARQLDNQALIKEAMSEHEEATRLIRHIGEIDAHRPAFVAKVTELAEKISFHVRDEESVLFPQVLVSGIDLVTLGEQLHTAKNDMRVGLGLLPED
jgi:iron-sulfur cluster repair protein YtfE (RIC family)